MRTATLYELKASHVGVVEPFIRKRVMEDLPRGSRYIEDGTAIVPVRDVVLPIEKISRIEHGQRKDYFIALDTDLREILEAPFATKMLALESHHRIAIGKYRERIAEYQDRIAIFNLLPWYKRWFSRP